jgi:integrase
MEAAGPSARNGHSPGGKRARAGEPASYSERPRLIGSAEAACSWGSRARQGELAALTWDDYNPATGALSITKTVVEDIHTHHRRVKEPKTESSIRNILLSPEACGVLEEHRGRMEAEGHGSSLIFPARMGGYLKKSHFRDYYWLPITKRAGLEGLRPHDLRHTTATLLLGAGLSVKLVADRLGHGNAGTTLKTYAHSLPAMHTQAAHTMGRLLDSCSRFAVVPDPQPQNQNPLPPTG